MRLRTGLKLTERSGCRGDELLWLLVRSIKGVDEGVDSSAIGTVWHQRSTGGSLLSLGSKGGSVLVEAEVTVSGVMGVDKGVEVGVSRLIVIIIIVKRLLGDRCSCLSDRG